MQALSPSGVCLNDWRFVMLRHSLQKALVFLRISSLVAVLGSLSAVCFPRLFSAQAAPTRLFLDDLPALQCEFWIDKALAEAVATSSEGTALWHTRLYLKIDASKVDLSEMESLSFYGVQRYFVGDEVVEQTPIQTWPLRKFDGSSLNYYVQDLGNLSEPKGHLIRPQNSRLEWEGAYVLQLKNGQRLWLNKDNTPYAHWVFRQSLEEYLSREKQTLGSAGVAALNTLDQAKKTATFSTELNPQRCQ
jgi:hypothetical protein